MDEATLIKFGFGKWIDYTYGKSQPRSKKFNHLCGTPHEQAMMPE